MYAVFIDLRSAYNTIDRKRLFELIRAKNILKIKEANFLEMLYDSIYF